MPGEKLGKRGGRWLQGMGRHSRIREKHFAGGMGLEDGNGPTEAGMRGENGTWRSC